LAAVDTFELTVNFYDEHLPAPAPSDGRSMEFEPSVEVVWEYCTDYTNWEDDEAWKPLDVIEDGTNAFYQGGIIRLQKPGERSVETESVPVLGQRPGLVWIRCRLEQTGYEIPPQLNTISLNVLNVVHRATVEDELLSRADGTLETTIHSGQTFFFEHTPVLEADIVIDDEEWTEVQDFDRSNPSDRHYVLDHRRGSITFGDGIHGAKPPVGEHVFAERYVYGGGEDGNVTEPTDWTFERADEEIVDGVQFEDISLSQMRPASGGINMESFDDALERFKQDLKRTYRASSLTDYSRAAMQTPGLRFGRAHATTQMEETPDGDTIEVVHVIVVPYSTYPQPQPSEGFLEAVQTYLDTARLVTDVVRVDRPSYVTIGGTVVVSSDSGYSETAVAEEVREELAEYLHPIRGYDGTGWPFGRLISTTEVGDILTTLPHVDSVEDVVLTASGEEETDEHGNVILSDTTLPVLSKDDLSVVTTDGGETQ